MKVMDKHRNPKALKAVRDAANGRAQGDKPAQATKDSLPGSWAMSNRKKLLSKVNEAEELLAAVLTRCGLVFTREHVVRCNGNVYYIDFAAEVEGVGIVGIEVDGSQHARHPKAAEDILRDNKLRELGWTVLRFWNDDVLRDIDNVCMHIVTVVSAMPANLSPENHPR